MRSARQPACLGQAGSILFGSRLPVQGRVRNTDLQGQGLGTFSLDFVHEPAILDDESFFFDVFANALPAAEVDPVEGFLSDPMGTGNTQVAIEVRRLPETTRRFHADPLGRRSILVWSPVDDSDTRSYSIYWDAGTGTVSTASPLAVVSDIAADRVDRMATTDGTGSGRITVKGVYNGPAVNAVWAIEITGTGLFQYDAGDGLNGEDIAFDDGSNYSLPDGLRIVFEDSSANYDDGDRFEFRVGPSTIYVTDELEPGDYLFKVAAVDAAGNEGTLSSAVSVRIDPAPEAPSGVSASWDADTRTITISWTDPEDVDLASIRIYANYHAQAEELLQYVYEIAPLDTVSEGVETWSIVVPEGVEGEWLFYVRAVDDEGKEDDNSNLIRLDALAVPVSPLPAPFELAAEPVAAGAILLTWLYDSTEGIPASFNVYTFTTATPSAADYAAATPDSVDNATPTLDGNIGIGTFTTGDLSGLTRYFAVRGVDDNGDETESSNIASATGDGTAPAGVPTLRGLWT